MPISRLLRKLNPTLGDRVRSDRLTYLTIEKLDDLEAEAERVLEQHVDGMFVEAGVALGGASILLATWAQRDSRDFRGYDVFDMIPPPGERDDDKSHNRYEVIASGESKGLSDDEAYYGYRDDLLGEVTTSFERYGLEVDGEKIRLVEGLFEDTMSFDEEPIALVHVDCDWYEPVRFVLETTYAQMRRGAAIIVDDYHDYGGCREACDEFIASHDVTVASTTHHLILHRN